eukprot:TRINITY_DN14792_c0_g1_i2.p1 TRINITY_DN14792_c0_g1~~TRINITY_DN14792_c0_g1_i2.p1  ORF type:complete len:174 (-),score=24.64 TRINITY_DN14792_c0_g1_i2:84-605(-)
MMAGHLCIEILKFIAGRQSTDRRNLTVDMTTDPSYKFCEPPPPERKVDVEYDPIIMGPVKAVPYGFTPWDLIYMEGPLTFGELLKIFEENFSAEVTGISCDREMLFYDHPVKETPIEKMNRTIEEEYVERRKKPLPNGQKYLLLSILGQDLEKNDCEFPDIKYEIGKKQKKSA